MSKEQKRQYGERYLIKGEIMAAVGQIINKSNLTSGWIVEGQIIWQRDDSSEKHAYVYLNAPSFIIGIRRYNKSNAIDLRNIAYYNYSTGNWVSSDKSMGVPTGSTSMYYWAHNVTQAQSGVTHTKQDTSNYHLWRFDIYMKGSSGDGVIAQYWAGPVGLVSDDWYNNNIKGQQIKSCGAKTLDDFSWVANGTKKNKFFWVHSNWGQNDSGAVSYFQIGNDRGNLIYTSDLGKICARGG